MSESNLFPICIIISVMAVIIAVTAATPYDEQPEAKLEQEVKASVMMKLCFPQGIYTQSAHKYCQKFKEDLVEHMTLREQQVAEKCLRDNVNINKCVRVK